MLLQIVILLAGFGMLIVGADQLVKGASSIAKRYGISNLVIGLTIVAFGSSAPELVVNLFAAARGSSEMAIGNIMGSNIANVLLILGVAAMIRPLVIERVGVWREIPFAILGGAVVLALSADQFLGGSIDVISRGEGIALLGFFAIFMYFTFFSVLRNSRKENGNGGEKVAKYSKPKSYAMIAWGLGGLVVGGHLIVESATGIALSFGVSEALIAVTVVAIGTSLPELAAASSAAYHGHTDMAIGAVVGSIIFNTLWIIGLSALIHPLDIHAGGLVEVSIAFFATFLLFPFMLNGPKVGELRKWEGALFVALYIAFIVFSIWRG